MRIFEFFFLSSKSGLLQVLGSFGFWKMGLNRIEVFIMPRNRRSIKMIKGLGFKKEGVLRERYFDEFGNFCDDVLFSMLRADWEVLRAEWKRKRNL